MGAAETMDHCLAELGLKGDPEMARTGERFTEFLSEYASTAPLRPLSVFEVKGSGPVVVRGLPFHSLCAHHLLPFFGTADVAYLPDGRVVGLGGVPRLVEHHSRRPQLQERLAEQIADGLVEAIGPRALVVRLVARQMCVEMRGVRKPAEFEVLARRGTVDAELTALVTR